jgi:pimeloyl-ACP methyl ester carboxylesterase
MIEPENRPNPKKRWPWIVGAALLFIVLWHVLTDRYRDQEKALRTYLRETVEEAFPDQKAKFSETFGLARFGPGRKESAGSKPLGKTVVLIHGLDDPGEVWQNLAPVLVRAGFDVWRMHYPNDQPITASARFFFAQARELVGDGIDRIAIVAHSMGGLVSRELLTRPDIGYRKAAESGQVPEVIALVMVGTPNHGSQMARFRVLTEIRDQFVRITKGEGNWLGAILDGAGEAKIDLLPGSRFLSELNARPHPDGVGLLVIAGVASPWSENDIGRWLDRVGPDVPDDRKGELVALGDIMTSMTRGLGDGLVTATSARLKGVPLITVEGTHLSMIRNVTTGSRRTPPAVPIIVRHLQKMEKRGRER